MANLQTETLSIEKIKVLIETNHVVYAQPRKLVIVVDGFKRYAATKEQCRKVKELNDLKK